MTPTVAFLVPRFPAETFIQAQVEGLLERGLEVEVYALAAGSKKVAQALTTRWGGRLRIHTVPISRAFLTRAAASIPSLLKGNFAALSPRFGSDATSLRLLVASNRWPPMPARPRVWLAQYGRWGRFACSLREVGIISGPIATIFHGKDMSAYLDRSPDAYRLLLRQGELFLPISELWRDKLLALGAPPETTVVHRMGVDTKLFVERARNLQKGEPVRFVSVGRMVEKKGFDDAIAGFANFQSQPDAPSASLTLIGNGPMKRSLERQAAKAGLAEKIRFAGLIPIEQVAAELNAAHIFVLPSRTAADGDMEGIPVAIMEAMAQGMPVLTTRHSGIPELVEHGVSGLLSAEGDRANLAANMASLAASPEQWPAMGSSGARRVRDEFDLNIWNGRLADRMRNLVEPAPASR